MTGDHTLTSFLERFPWTDDERAQAKPLEFLWTYHLDVTRGQIWPYLIDTSRFNRALGLSRMYFAEEGGTLKGTTRNLVFQQDWIEVPWTWIAERQLVGARIYSRGFAHLVRSIYLLEPIDDGRRTRFTVYFGWLPRNFATRAFLKVAFGTFQSGYQRVLDGLVHTIQTAAQTGPYVLPAAEPTDAQRTLLDAMREKVRASLAGRGVRPTALDALIRHVSSSDEMDLQRLQVIPLARAWHVDEDEALKTCLHATRAGLLNLSWDVICPHCRGVREEARTLGDVPGKSACDVCKIDFDTAAENSIEITFRVHPQVRPIEKVFFCAAEPAKKAHIELQQSVPAGARLTFDTTLPVGRWRLRVGSDKVYRLLDVVASGGVSELTWTTSDEGDLPRAAPGVRLSVVNDRATAQTFVVERAGWADDALRPVRLFSLQEFRDLFTEEYLTAGVQLSVGEQTILFTDMIGSTKFYDARGDAEAFAEVKKHFTEIYEIVKTHRGAVVKTIGDAVMAAFHDPVDALAASLDIHAAFYAGRKDTSVRLRISLNRGPCIAVNLNSAIDYFGRTVNVASKLQACAEAGQIAFPTSLVDTPSVKAFLDAHGGRLVETAATSSTLTQPIAALRWDVNDVVAARRSAA